jgi:hypothetical protein
MTDVDGTVAELAELWPALAAALARDAAGEGAPGIWVSMGVVNADVLAAMLTVEREVPEATARARELIGEPWHARELLVHLRQVPRLAARLHAVGRQDAAGELAWQAAGWLRLVKRALGLRKPDMPFGDPPCTCPWAARRPENHPGAALLRRAGEEGFLRPGPDGPRVQWEGAGLIYCPAEACGATWDYAHWALLGRMLAAERAAS